MDVKKIIGALSTFFGKSEDEKIRETLGALKVDDMIKEGVGAGQLFELCKGASRFYVNGLSRQGKISFSQPREGDVPSIHIVRRTVPEAWEDTVMALMAYGQPVHTGYDPVDKAGKYTSFPSQEATVIMHIEEPHAEPRFHKHFLGGWMGFGDYQAEIEGVKDHWMLSPAVVVDMLKKGKFDEIKDNKKWKYTYHQRVTAHPYIDIHGEPQVVDQINSLIQKLKREPLSKSAQATTWDPRWDHNDGQIEGVRYEDYDSPCLQRFWFRLIPTKDGGYQLNLNSDWRSRDHLKAVPQNIYGVINGFYEHVRKNLEQELGAPVKKGRYLDKSDSLHLYGHYYDYRKQGKDAESYIQDIFRVASGEPLEKRVIHPGEPMYEMMMEDIANEYKFRVENPNAGLSVD